MISVRDAATWVIQNNLRVQPGEHVVVLTDEWRREIGLALFYASRRAGAEAIYMEILERDTHGAELPPAAAAAIAEAHVVIAPTSKSISHTAARHAATMRGARCASMPEVTEGMMMRSLRASPERLKVLGKVYADALTQASTARVTTYGGTDITMSLDGRTAISDDGDLSLPGAFGNLPAGEAFLAPVEGTASGVVVVDGSLAPDGSLPEPVRIVVEGGQITSVDGMAAPRFAKLSEKHGPEAWHLAELGVGTNELATLTGNILEDEKVAGTIHIAFGNNIHFGGTIGVAAHHDGIVKGATLELDGRKVLESGKLLLDPASKATTPSR